MAHWRVLDTALCLERGLSSPLVLSTDDPNHAPYQRRLYGLKALHWAPADAPALAKCLFHEMYGAMETI